MNSEVKAAAPRPRTALVVGTNPDVIGMVACSLDGWNIEVCTTNREALDRVHSEAFDLVLTAEDTSAKADVELLREIRTVRPHTRLIILTSESTSSDVIAAMRERAFSYFSSPFSPASLTQMLQLAADEPAWDDGIEIVAATREWVRIIARCDKKTADRLLQFFHEMVDLYDEERESLATAFREMLLNAIEHGGHFDPSQYVEISYVRARHVLICRVKDPGEGFSLDEIQHAATANPPDDPLRHHSIRDAQGLRPGGFGVLLTRHLVDELIYSEKGNEVLLVKYLPSESNSFSDSLKTA